MAVPPACGKGAAEGWAEQAGAVTDPYLIVLLAVIVVVLLSILVLLVVWQWRRPPQAKDDDKALEALRIIYGFWLIVSALLVALLVLVVTLTAPPATATTADIVAVIGTVTGLITTLVAAFFGIQQAGAGRSQAMTALAQLRAPGPDGAGATRLEPSYGPHSGGTKVSVTGNGFTGASAVNFGASQGANFRCENDGLMTVNSPPAQGKANDAKVSIIFPSTSSPNREIGTFYYYTIHPSHGSETGELVRIYGSGLKDVSAVKFGDKDGIQLEPLKIDENSGREYRDVIAPPGTGDVPIKLVFPVETEHKISIIGSYHYDAFAHSPP